VRGNVIDELKIPLTRFAASPLSTLSDKEKGNMPRFPN
jgi:hypothetical protein